MTTSIPADKEIDARGSHCPGPMLELIRGIKSVAVGNVVAVRSGDTGSRNDIPIWIKKAGHELLAVEELGDSARFVVRKGR